MNKERSVFVNWSNQQSVPIRGLSVNLSDDIYTGFFVLSTCLLDLRVDEVALILGYLGGFVIFIPEQQIRVTLGKFRRPAAI